MAFSVAVHVHVSRQKPNDLSNADTALQSCAAAAVSLRELTKLNSQNPSTSVFVHVSKRTTQPVFNVLCVL